MPLYYPLNAGTYYVEATSVTSATVTQFQGRVVKADWNEGLLNLIIQDNLKNLDWARFVWDYEPIGSNISGDYYGTIDGISGSNIYYNDAYGNKYVRRTSSGTWTAWEGEFNISDYRGWRSISNLLQLYDLNAVPDDAIVKGDYLKFSPNWFPGTEAGGTLYTNPVYGVRGGTIISNNGTIELDKAPLDDVQPGDYIYVRKPLIYSGNPADIIWNMLTGSNTDLEWDSTEATTNNDIEYNSWSQSRSSLVPLGDTGYYKEITDEGTGAVIAEIRAISQDCLANAFIDEENRFVWQAYRPRTVPSTANLWHFHEATAVSGLTYSENIEDLYTRCRIDYRYNPHEDDPRLMYAGRIDRQDSEAGSKYYDLNRTKVWQSEWMQDYNFARQQAIRFLKRYSDSPNRVEFESSLYGLLGTLSGFFALTHQTASRATSVYEITETSKQFSSRRVRLDGIDASDIYYGKGFALWEDGTHGTGTVTSTTTAGWGTADSTSPTASGGTCYGIDTMVYGSVFKWW